MAPELSRKRKRATVSYKEPSSDVDFSDLDAASITTLPTRRSARHHSTEPAAASSSRQSQHIASHNGSLPFANRRALRRHRKRTISYREETTDDDSEGYEPEDAGVRRKPREEPASRRSTPRKPFNGTLKKTARPKERVLAAPLKKKTLEPEPTVHIPTDGHKPSLSSLPYHVLLQIFVYASHPLHDENIQASPSISWLVQMAGACQAFTKPALTALYRNPPIFAIRQNRRSLVNHLISPPTGAHQDYQVMVKRLELDATQMSALTDATHSVADLASLVSALSTLREIDIFDPLDRPPYRERLKRIRRWNYPNELFDTLRRTELRLRSWRWHSAYCNQGLLWVKDIHADPAFQSLRELTFVKFNTDVRRKPDATDPTTEELLASAIAVLPNLHSLAFESCTAVNGKLLSLLPSTLLSLNITNCIDLTSDALQTFLSDHGRHLEELVLNHNQSLDLSFLVTLKESCPRLEVLKMDLNYYSTLALSSDNEPLYDWLIGLDEVPTWPTTLRIIDLVHLRKWGADSATSFFKSLIDSAADLPFLRELRIMGMVDMEWRQRADFRRKWAARFDKVFAQRCAPPNPHLASLRAYRQWEAAQKVSADRNDSLLDIVEGPQDRGAPVDKDGESDSDVPLVSMRKDERWNTRRLRDRGKGFTNYDETSENEKEDDERSAEDEREEHEPDDEEPTVIQGRCHTVLFRIDNLRPREELYDEGDFLDEERSGDEEWDEANDGVEDGHFIEVYSSE